MDKVVAEIAVADVAVVQKVVVVANVAGAMVVHHFPLSWRVAQGNRSSLGNCHRTSEFCVQQRRQRRGSVS